MAADPAVLLEGRYAVERQFAGAMGRLFVVRDPATGERLAVKTIRADLGGEMVSRRFQVEARAWIALGRHPHVVEARFFREWEGHPLLFLEYVDGTDLERLLAATGPLPLAQAVEFGRHLLLGLAHAHRTRMREGVTGLVHRDLKPANLLIGKDRVLKVTDWGLVKILGGTRHTVEGQMLGTLSYCAPEQLSDAARADPRADLYGVGAILYEMVAGRRPFPGDDAAHVVRALLTERASSLASVVPACPAALSDLVGALLEKDPDRRPASAEAVLDHLAAVPVTTSGAPACGRCGLLTQRALAPCPLCDASESGTASPPGAGSHMSQPSRPALAGPQDMVAVPAGAFRFGPDGAPASTHAYRIDRLPVTNRQFLAFAEATSYRPEESHDFLRHWHGGAPPAALLDHPVVWVSAHDAAAYAAWAGKAVPTWEEWEKAARGTDARPFPWGFAFEAARANSREGGLGGTTPVTRFPAGASPFGCLDMAGNVCQWTDTWREPELRRTKVVCGGSWAQPLAPHGLRRVRSLFPGARDFQTGFRCVHRGAS